MLKYKVIIAASGSGERFGSKTPKQFQKINGKEILAITIDRFHRISLIDEIVISTKPEYFTKVSTIIRKNNFRKVKKIVEGGKRRQDSVYNALLNLDNCNPEDVILVHDGVRPFVSSKLIHTLMEEVKFYDGVIPVLPVSETVKEIEGNIVRKTIDRSKIYFAQTPQVFRYEVLKRSFEKAYKENFDATDESSIVENAGYKIKSVQGESKNIKITLKDDLKR